MELLMLQKYGKVKNLRFQVDFPLKVHGMLIATYRADATYDDIESGKFRVEDTKPEEFMDDMAKLKIRLFNALHQSFDLQVTIARRKS